MVWTTAAGWPPLARSGARVVPLFVVAHTRDNAGGGSTTWVGMFAGVFFQTQGDLMVFKYGGMGWYWWLVTNVASLFGDAIFPVMTNEMSKLAAGTASTIWDKFGTHVIWGSVAGVAATGAAAAFWPATAATALIGGGGLLGQQILSLSTETAQDLAMNA
eukprot:907602-Rhodomonas_salina.1